MNRSDISTAPLTVQEQPQDIFQSALGPSHIQAASTSAGWVEGPDGTGQLVYSGYFRDSQGNGDVKVGFAQESSSTPVWNICLFSHTCLQAGPPCCGNDVNINFAVPMFTDPNNPGHSQVKWGGDPYLVTGRDNAPSAGLVLVLSLGISQDSNNGSGHTDLVLATQSWDGGKTYVQTDLVNDGHCDSGAMQMPTAFLDPARGRVWVVWRYNNFPDLGGTYGACIRRGDIDVVNQKINWGTVFDIQNLNRQQFDGVGGLMVDGSSLQDPPVVTVVYSNTDHTYTCPDGDDKDVAWYEVSTTDDGQDCSASTLIRDTQTFTWCPAGGKIQNSLRAFSFLKTITAGQVVEWAALNVSRNQIELWKKDEVSPWTLWFVWTTAATESRFFPSLASDDGENAHLAVEFLVNDSAGVRPEYAGTTNALQNIWDSEFALQGQAPLIAGDLSLGKYVSLGARPPIPGVPAFMSYLATYPEWIFNPATGQLSGPFLASDRVGTQQ